MKPIEDMKAILTAAKTKLAESHPELRAHTNALICVSEVLADFHRRLSAIERALGLRS